jgi:hemerythrin
MSLIVWNDNLSVHIGEIDRQHQQLIKMINDLDDAMRQGKGKEVLFTTLSSLINYALGHFETEEKYFAQFGYGEAAVHKKEHLAFAGRVSDFKNRFTEGQIGLSIEVMDFLSQWLTGHIKGSDKRYAPFLKSKGLN